jgi:SAM-dependent methyltransferase
MDVQELAPGARQGVDGYWIVPDQNGPVSYPEGGNDFVFEFEESSFWFAHRTRVIGAAVRRYPPSGGPIFDVGAGNGHVAAALHRAGFPTLAIEPNRSGAANAVRRGVPDVVCGSLPSPAFKLGGAGAIGLFDVIEHVGDDRTFLRSLHPYLEPGGRVYVTVPAYQWLWSRNDVVAGHHQRYTLRQLRSTMTDAGYAVEYSTYFFWSLPLPILLFRTLSSRVRTPAQSHYERSRSQHVGGSRFVRLLAERSFAFESRLVGKGMRIPFGGSCLVVARSV